MNLLGIILGYAASMIFLIGVLAFAALSSPHCAIGSGVMAVWTAFGAAHLAKVRQNNMEWEDATRHPRI